MYHTLSEPSKTFIPCMLNNKSLSSGTGSPSCKIGFLHSHEAQRCPLSPWSLRNREMLNRIEKFNRSQRRETLQKKLEYEALSQQYPSKTLSVSLMRRSGTVLNHSPDEKTKSISSNRAQPKFQSGIDPADPLIDETNALKSESRGSIKK